ncbi:MAG: two-component system, cell cycle response regulator [Actinomycetota bacterium]|jgi:CheY-like chemotaxis protein|nr:two-component system, cell cycle response regulator [Actinomycetota bacterium]
MGFDPGPWTSTPGRGRREHPSPRALGLTTGRNPSPGGRRELVTILLVEEDARLARLVAGVLREADGEFRVEHVARLSRALTRLARPGVDLVLADPDLPDSAGAATVRMLRRAMPEIPLVIVSASDDVAVALEAVRAGADEYVVKRTFSVETVVWLVRLVLARHRRFVDGPTGEAFDVVARHLIPLADRAGVHLGVLFLGLEPAPRGELPDIDRLLEAMSRALRETLRRCDVVSRLGRSDLAVLLVSEGPPSGALRRLEDALSMVAAGDHVRIGFAGYDRSQPTTVDDLLQQARVAAHRIFA